MPAASDRGEENCVIDKEGDESLRVPPAVESNAWQRGTYTCSLLRKEQPPSDLVKEGHLKWAMESYGVEWAPGEERVWAGQDRRFA